MMRVEKVILAKPRGYCAGVAMAVETVERALKRHGAPLYVFHEIVHNRHVVHDFTSRGVRFVQSVDEVPPGSKLIFSAHGIAPAVWQQAKERGINLVIDATCPLVEKVHREVRKFAALGYCIILVGHEKHDEIEGTKGEAPERISIVANVAEAQAVEVANPNRVVVLTQTTLSLDDTREVVQILRERFPLMVTPAKEDICYATQNRQDAVKQLAREVELVLVVGSSNSENSNQLCRVARAQGAKAYLIDDHRGIDVAGLTDIRRVGITSGASVPEQLVQDVVDFFKEQGAEVSHLGLVEENIHFALPPEIVTATNVITKGT